MYPIERSLFLAVLRRPVTVIIALSAMLLVVLALLASTGASGAQSATPRPTALEGVVLDANGAPIKGARISDGKAIAITGSDGIFSFEAGAIGSATSLQVSAAGYRDHQVSPADFDPRLTVTLELRPIYALYLNPVVTTSLDEVDALIEVINTTNANAVVIDIKEEWVWYDTDVQFYHDVGTVRPAYDLAQILDRFHQSNIYTIARLVVFKDSTVAEAKPEFAIRDTRTGGPWRDFNGVAWVNPMQRELWTPNLDLAVEAASAGFDEIQYDYIRFPTDGDLTTMDFGQPYTQQARQSAIEGFLSESRRRLLPTGTRQSADVFGFTMLVDDDLGIGQHFATLAGLLDYLSPMVYPSHYSEGQFGLPGHPNDFPYEVVDISLQGGVERLGGQSLQIRPWLQDFDLYGMNRYGSAEVRAQIQAANEHGTSGWMLWDPENRFRAENLEPATESDVPNPENAG
jgi:hypothetical protein